MLIHHIKKDMIMTQPAETKRRQEHHFDGCLQSLPEKTKILILELDHVYRETLCRFARRRGAVAIGCGTFQQLKNTWIGNPPDVVIISFVVDEKTKAPDIIRLLGNVPVLITKHPKIDVQINFVWPNQLKKISSRTDGAGTIIDDALAFAAEFRSDQQALIQMKSSRA